jgi:hypothetical protein
MIMSGMRKPRNWLNTLLNVTNTRTHASGSTFPINTPSTMAIMMRGNNPIFFISGAKIRKNVGLFADYL